MEGSLNFMENKKIAGKLVSILETLGSVPKKGFNKAQNYHYTREVDVLDALKKELISNKIILLTSSKLIETLKKDRTDSRGNLTTDIIAIVETNHRFIDSESGEELSINSVGSGIDSGDKFVPKSITSSVKYALMKTFMISDEAEDIEFDHGSKNDSIKDQTIKGFNRNKPTETIDATKSASAQTTTINGNSTTVITANTNIPIADLTQSSKPGFSRRSTNNSKEPSFP